LPAISCNFWLKTNIAVLNTDIVPVDPFLSVQDILVLVLIFFFYGNCTYLWHYFHSVLVNEQKNTSLLHLLSVFPASQLFLDIF
jgi:hypothetical protein